MAVEAKKTPVIEISAMLHAAVSALATVCDGAAADDGRGFNKFDAQWGREVAGGDPSLWDSARCSYILKRITKYRSQLSGYGVDLESIPEIDVEHEREVLSRGGGQVSMKWSLDDPLFGEIKETVKRAGARWNAVQREWVWSVDMVSTAIGIAEGYEFVVSPEAQAVFDGKCRAYDEETITFDGGVFVLRFAYDADALSEMRRFWGRCRWDMGLKVWNVEAETVNAARIFEFAENWGLTVDDEATGEARRLMDELAFSRDNGAPCDGRSCDECDAPQEVCPDKSRWKQQELSVAESRTEDKWGSGWTASGAKSLFE